MRFFTYESSYDEYRHEHKRLKSRDPIWSMKEFYQGSIKHTWGTPADCNQLIAEFAWYRSGKPYYNFHPNLIQVFGRSKLNFPARYVELPYPAIAVHFSDNAKELSWENGKHRVRSALVFRAEGNVNTDTGQLDTDLNNLIIWMDINEVIPHNTLGLSKRIYTYRQFRWNKGSEDTVDSLLYAMPTDPTATMGILMPEEIVLLVIKLVVSIAFLAVDNSPVVVPHVLNRHLEEFKKATKEQQKELHSKATQERGSRGWQIGIDEMFEKGFIGPAQPRPEPISTGRHLEFAHIVTGYWKLVRYGPKLEHGRVRWLMPYVRGEGLPFKPPPKR